MSQLTKMSVTRALAELKRLDDRILAAQAGEAVFVSVAIGQADNKKPVAIQGSVDLVRSKIQSAFDTIEALFKKREAIKGAIVKSNAATMVTIGNRTMSVAEAIELKRSITIKQAFRNVLQQQYRSAMGRVSELNAQLDSTIEVNLKSVYGSDKSKVDQSTFDSIAKPQRALKEASLIDPADVLKVIANLSEEISQVETELDFTLSEINARTEIEV